MRILEDNSLIQQIAKTAVPYPIHKSLRQVAPQLIGIDLENQLGLCGNCGADAAENREHQQLDGFLFSSLRHSAARLWVAANLLHCDRQLVNCASEPGFFRADTYALHDRSLIIQAHICGLVC